MEHTMYVPAPASAPSKKRKADGPVPPAYPIAMPVVTTAESLEGLVTQQAPPPHCSVVQVQSHQPVNVPPTPEVLDLPNKKQKTNKTPRKAKPTLSSDASKSWLSPKELKDLEKKGVAFKKGVWSADETALLRSNIEEYCKNNDVPDVTNMLFHQAKDGGKRRGKDEFFKTVAEGLNRPLFAVYRKVMRDYDPLNNKGPYSKEEDEMLKTLHTQYHNDWQTIGTKMGRSYTSVKDRTRRILSGTKGEWTPEEEQKLVEGIKAALKLGPGENIPCIELVKVPWKRVAEHVGTRDAHRCRHKWMHSVGPRTLSPRTWDPANNLKLIDALMNTSLDYEYDVRWQEIRTQLGVQLKGTVVKKAYEQLKRALLKGQKFPVFPETLREMKSILLKQQAQQAPTNTLPQEPTMLTPAVVTQPADAALPPSMPTVIPSL